MGVPLTKKQGDDATAALVLSSSPLDHVSIKPTEREVEALAEILSQSMLRFQPSHIREAEAEVIHQSLAKVEQYVTELQQILLAKWEIFVGPRMQEECTQDILKKVFLAALPAITDETLSMVANLLTIVADSEVHLINNASSHAGTNPKAKGASNRNKAKLAIQLHLEKNMTGVQNAILLFREEVVEANADRVIEKILAPLHREAQEAAEASGLPLSTAVTKSAFVEAVIAAIVMVVDAAKVVEDSALLGLVHGGRSNRAGGGGLGSDELLSTRISLHASRLIAFSDQKEKTKKCFGAVALTDAALKASEEEKFTALVVETPHNLQRIFAAKDLQLERLIGEMHKYSCIPPMYVTLTNASGTEIIELDATSSAGGCSDGGDGAGGQKKGSVYHFRAVSAATKQVKRGRYCRISPAVLLLLVQTVAHNNTVVEHSAETVYLVREEGSGWKNLSTGVCYDTIIPNVL